LFFAWTPQSPCGDAGIGDAPLLVGGSMIFGAILRACPLVIWGIIDVPFFSASPIPGIGRGDGV